MPITSRGLLITARDYLILTIGVLCYAASIDLFLVPNNVVAGGVTGVSILLRKLVGTPVGLVYLIINIPIYLVGLKKLGGVTFGIRTAYATIALSIAVDLMTPLAQKIHVKEPLLYTFYGGLLEGVGLGLVFRAKGTTGGVDILARLLQQAYGIRIGQAMLAMDAAVFTVAGLIFGAEPAMYALLVAFVSSRVVNVVLEGTNPARSALIVTKKPEAIRDAVLTELRRSVTLLDGRGGFTGGSQPVVLCVVALSEEEFLKGLIVRLDPDAFVVMLEAKEVLGEGFTRIRGV